MCICEDMCKSFGMHRFGKMASTLKWRREHFVPHKHDTGITFALLILLPSIGSPYLTDDWLTARWVYFTIDCVSVNYTVFSVVLILWIILPVGQNSRWFGRSAALSGKTLNTDLFVGASEQCRGGFAIAERLLKLKKVAAKKCMSEVNLLR